ncbi:MAG: sodium:solute symporter family protein [Bacillota bacterium]
MRWDLIVPVIGMYVLVAIIAGIALRRVKTSVDYMLAGRQLGYGLMIPHIVGAFFGAGSTIGIASLSYIWGLGGAWYNMAEALGLWLLMAFLARRLWHLGRRLNFVTLPDLLESYYGRTFKAITGLFIALGYASWVAGQIAGAGRVLQQVTGFPLLYSIIIGTLLVGFYAGFGGLWGSVFADLVFGSLTVIGALIVGPILVHQFGGWNALLAKLPAGYASFFWLGEKAPFAGMFGWTSLKQLVWYILVFTPAFAIGQLNIQRIYASKDEGVAHGMSTFIASYVFVQPVFFALIGMIAFALNPKLPSRDAAAPWVMANAMGPVLGALFLCSLVAVIMSCAAAGLNTAVASLVRDIWRLINPKLDELRAGRILSVWVMAASFVFAVLIPDVVGWLSLGFTLMGISLFVPTVVMVATRGRPTKWATATGAVWSSVIGGGVAILWKALMQMYGKPFTNWDPIFIGLPVEIVLLLAISRMTASTCPPQTGEQAERLKVVREVFDQVRPTWSKEGWGTVVFLASMVLALWILPWLFQFV